MTIWRPSIAAGTTAQQSTSGRVATIIPPECCDRWRGRPWASRDSSTSQRQRPLPSRPLPSASSMSRSTSCAGPALRPARDALDLARRQPERLAQLADRPARAERREGGDERRALAAVALVHARDQDLADVAREVEVDVRQRADLLVEEAPEQQPVLDRVDVRKAGEVADDRRHGRAAAAAGRQQRARRVGPADLDGDLAGELEHVAVQQEEARQPEAGDQAQLLVEARGGLRAQAPLAGVALLEARGADACERRVGLRVLGAGVAVAEVLREIEAQRVGQTRALGDRVGVVGEAGGHRLGRGEHVRVVAAAQRLGRVERAVLADRHERVLQAGAPERVRVDVAGGHARHAEPGGQRGQAAVERAVVTVEGALQLDPERVVPEDPQQAAHRRLVAHAVARAATEADEPRRVGLEVVEPDRRGAEDPAARVVARVRVRAREEPAQVRPALRVAHEQGDVALVVQRDLRAMDRPQSERARRLGELHRSRHGVVIGQRQGRVAALERGAHQLLGLGGAVEEREGRVRVELDVGHERMFA